MGNVFIQELKTEVHVVPREKEENSSDSESGLYR